MTLSPIAGFAGFLGDAVLTLQKLILTFCVNVDYKYFIC